MRAWSLRIVCTSAVALAFCSFAAGQGAQISGIVTDSSQMLLPSANIAVLNEATGVAHTTHSDASGHYVVTFLNPGSYRITVDAVGFKSSVQPGITLNVGDEARLDFSLKVGTVNEIVEVEAGSPLLETESASVGTVVDRQFIENMPLNGRSFQSLVSLTPGVVISAAGAGSSAVQGQFTINGQRANGNYFTIDGVSASAGVSSAGTTNSVGAGSGVQGSATGGYNNLVSVDALQEFKIETSGFAPEFGRLPGGQISMVTRGGTNKFHGAAFDYLRNSALDANSWLNRYLAIPRPQMRQNDFGGVFGGPVIKNKLFFFTSYEGLRLTLPQTLSFFVPSASARAAAPPLMQAALNTWPTPNGSCNCSDPNLAFFTGNVSSPTQLDAGSARFDYSPTLKLTMFGRVNIAPSYGIQLLGGPSFLYNESDLQTYTLSATYLVSPSISNDLRANYTFARGIQTAGTGGGLVKYGAVPLPSTFIYPPYTPANGQFFFGGFGRARIGAMAIGAFAKNRNEQFNIVDSVSWLRGAHQFRFGFDYRQLSPVGFRRAYEQDWEFFSTAALVTAMPDLFVVNDFVTQKFRFQNFSSYAQDTWKITRRLTITYGLRWDINPAPTSTNGQPPLALNINQNNPSLTTLFPVGTAPYKTEWSAIAPRLGVAYQLSNDAKYGRVVRAGWGVFYDTAGDAGGQLETVPGGNYQQGPFASSGFPTNPAPFTPGVAGKGNPIFAPPLAQLPYVDVTGTSPNLRLPYTYQMNAALQQLLGAGQSFTLTYAGALGKRLLRTELYGPGNPATISNTVSAADNSGFSHYHSFQSLYEKRLSHGLQIMGSYTWAHSNDNGSFAAFGVPSAAIVGANKFNGASDFDIRHSFQSALSYNIPKFGSNSSVRYALGNWGTDFIFRARSAPPIDLVVGGQNFSALPTQSNLNARPDVTGKPYWISSSAVPGGRYLNPAAFMPPPADSNGFALREGTLNRNALRGFGWNQLDFTLRRDFPIGERIKLHFRTDFFNILNHTSHAITQGALDITNTYISALPQAGQAFGVSNGPLNTGLGSGGVQGGYNSLYQIGGARSIQVSLKLTF